MTQIYKILNEEAPHYLKGLFVLKDRKYDMRNTKILACSDYATLKYGRNSFAYQGAVTWNSLPNDIKECKSLKDFKSKIAAWKGPTCICNTCLLCQLHNM